MTEGYVELHARSAFSWHRGASMPEALMTRAAELGHGALAVTDRDGIYGAPRLHQTGKEAGVRAIVGAEVTMEDESVLPLLVESRTGYRNLCRMLTRAKLRAPKNESRVAWKELADCAEGLVALTGDEEGCLRCCLARGDHAGARDQLERLRAIFDPDHLYVEVQRHRVRGEVPVLRESVRLAESCQLPLLATNGVLYDEPSRRAVMDAFTCLRNHTTLDAAGDRLAGNRERALKSAAEMTRLFRQLPHALRNTVSLSERLEFGLEDLGYHFPHFPCEAGETMADRLRCETYRGARERYSRITARVRSQLQHELELIIRLGFEGYFLIVWDLVRYARSEGILVQGRGSAANSAVCYCLGITAVDPIGSGLLFERFLSEGRNSWPDIDLDLPSGDRREQVIQEVYRRFAPYGAAMTANVITYRGRSAFREMAKVLDFPGDVMDRFSELFYSGDFPHTLKLEEQVRQSGVAGDHPRLPVLIQLYTAIHGMPRHLGQHSGGMVICSEGLDSIVPLENATMPGRRVLQWDKEDCADLGIIKVDLLGLGMMSAIQDTLTLCAERGHPVDLARMPQDDPATYAMMQRADTIGVFQIESRAQMATLPRMKPKCFYDVAIEVSLVRPGPITGDLTHPYLNRRDGKERVDYIHPDVKPVLERTLGVPLFQEQVLRMAMILADFSGNEAEELRRAMGFKRDDERLRKVGLKLREAMTRKGIAGGVQEKMVKAIGSFALYGFPESHAISFALLAYASTWLKCHRPVEFYTALLNNQPMGFYSPATLIKDAQRHGIRALAVSVIESDWEHRVVDERTIRLGLRQVKGLSRTGGLRIVEERRRQRWKGLNDFLWRTGLDRDERRVLAQIGALNGLVRHRREALWRVERRLDEADLFDRVEAGEDGVEFSQGMEATALLAEDSPAYGEGGSGGKGENGENGKNGGSPLGPMTSVDRLEADYQGLALTTGPHPMAYAREQLPGVWRAREILQATEGARITVAGMVICRQRPGTAKGNLFLSLEDETGISNAFVPKALFEKYRLLLVTEPFLKVTGIVQLSRGAHSILAEDVQPLDPGGAMELPSSHDFH